MVLKKCAENENCIAPACADPQKRPAFNGPFFLAFRGEPSESTFEWPRRGFLDGWTYQQVPPGAVLGRYCGRKWLCNSLSFGFWTSAKDRVPLPVLNVIAGRAAGITTRFLHESHRNLDPPLTVQRSSSGKGERPRSSEHR